MVRAFGGDQLSPEYQEVADAALREIRAKITAPDEARKARVVASRAKPKVVTDADAQIEPGEPAADCPQEDINPDDIPYLNSKKPFSLRYPFTPATDEGAAGRGLSDRAA